MTSLSRSDANVNNTHQPSADSAVPPPKKNKWPTTLSDLPDGIFAVSLFGMFLGLSTTMVYSQLPLFLTEELHATNSTVAFIDGLVEFLAYVTRVFAGMISDLLRDRKLILFIGCTVTLLIKPVLAFAKTSGMVVLVQSIERIGNGLQATPRDALIADLSGRHTRGQSYGFTKSLKTFGALLGTPLAIWIMSRTCNDYKTVFLCATIPVAIAIACLFKVKTSNKDTASSNQEASTSDNQQAPQRFNPFKRKYLKSLDQSFWKILILAFIFELGHFSEHMFTIYAKNFLDVTFAGSTGMFVSVGQVLLSFPIGIAADKFGKGRFIKVCIAIMIIANLSFLAAKYVSVAPIAYVYAGALLWGGQMTAVQGLFLALISEQINYHLRATAIGLYYCTIGVAYFIASNVVGCIWDSVGTHCAFLYSIFFCAMALLFTPILLPKKYSFGYQNAK